ncbi:MAG: SurA N-terminal domain-containing protein, partial [Pseudomonadota bacterium]
PACPQPLAAVSTGKSREAVMADDKPRKKKGNIVVWVILGLLILSLGGFGIGSFGGSLSSVASVGDREITVQDYGQALQNEQRQLQQQTGQPLTIQQMQAFGLDRAVMERLLAREALAYEANRMGLSVGDEEVATRIRSNPAFQGLDGQFDREGYGQALDFAGLNERGFERQTRDDAARELLQVAVVGGVEVPDAYADTLAAWLAETRTVTFAAVTVADLATGPAAPSEGDLEDFHAENGDLFRTPELRRITYAAIIPSRLAETTEVDDAAIRGLYEDRIDLFRQPARVLAERLAFADAAAAETARAAIDAGETTFEALVEERGLTLDDVDQGELAADDLDSGVAEALFALEEPGLVGPVDTALGPALYRVNAILDATEIPFEAVRDDLAAQFSADAARREIDAARENIDDLLAGGATLEEIADETIMELGTLEFEPGLREGIAGYDAFRSIARTVEDGDFPELEGLSDGGLFALRLDEIVPPELPPLADIRAEVEAAWRDRQDRARLLAEAEVLAARISDGETFEAVGLTAEIAEGVARDGTLDGVPAEFVPRLFEAEPGAVIAVEGDATRAWVARLDAVVAADLTAGEAADLRAAIVQQARQDIASDLFEAYGQAIQAEAGFSVNQQAVQAVQSQLLGGHGG